MLIHPYTYIQILYLTIVISFSGRLGLNSAEMLNITVYLDCVPRVYSSSPLAGSNSFPAPYKKSPQATHSQMTANKCYCCL